MIFKQKKRAFTLIELLVVIAIIGILATLAVVALQQARSRARDSKRMADMKQLQTAMELFFNENGRYPTTDEWNSGAITSSSSGETFMYSIPFAPAPADGDCLEASNTYVYTPQNSGASYTIDFCTGKQISDLPEGAKQMTPGGIIFDSSTPSEPADPFAGTSGTFTDTRDNQIYDWIKIGTQIWMAENLKYLPVVHNNTEFATQGTNLLPGYGVYGYDGNDVNTAKAQSNYDVYGVLYNGYTIDQVSICPTGWHVPTHDEFTTLERSVCTSATCETDFPYDMVTTGYRGTNEGAKLAGEFSLWTDGVLRNHINFGESGFDVLSAGRRRTNGLFYDLGPDSLFWLSSTNGLDLWCRYFGSSSSSIYRHFSSRAYGHSVRCLKN